VDEFDWVSKAYSGRSLDELLRVPSGEEALERYRRTIRSNYPLRNLGVASDSQIVLSEEDRESHIHILGAPGEGKSKFIELLMRQDIDAGYGCCLLDPSDNGDTAYKVLKYCLKKGVDKVLFIDPHDAQKPLSKVPSINPINYDAPANVSTGNLMDTIRVLWGSKGFEETPKITKYLPAILNAIHAAGMTLHEALYFTDQNHPDYKARREEMLDKLHPLDKDRVALESVFGSSKTHFAMEMDSTSRRLNPFFDRVMQVVVGSNQNPINFQKLVKEGWVILVNLDPTRIWGTEQQRLLGTLIVNEIIVAVDALRYNGWKGRYYLYIDEVGYYATRKLGDMLAYKRKSGLSLTLAHQYFSQIEDSKVADSIMANTKIKVLFNTPSRRDRDEVARMMYGGDVPDRQASHILGQMKKQYAAIKINIQPPRITRLPDVPDIQVTAEELTNYKSQLYQNEWYRSPAEVLDEINARFEQSQSEPPISRRHRNKGAVERTGEQSRPSKGSRSAKARAVPDNRTDSGIVLRRQKGRATRKVDPLPPKTE
jgi:hypothetical protein